MVVTNYPICDRINFYEIDNTTGIVKGFEGIPHNFIINIIVFILIFILFCLLREKAWNYGKLALHMSNHNEDESLLNYNVWTSVNYGSIEKTNNKTASECYDCLDECNYEFHKGYFTWMKFFWEISDKEIRDKAGLDAYHYLLFERYLILITFVLSVICLGIIMPINIFGSGKAVPEIKFVTTTVLNLPPTSPLIWVHAILSLIFFLSIICTVWSFVVKAKLTTFKKASNVLMIEGIPRKCCFKNLIMEHFKTAYPFCNIYDVQFAHNVKNLIDLKLQREIAVRAKKVAIRQFEFTGFRPTMVPIFCGRIFKFCLKEVDVIEYYGFEVKNLDIAIEREMLRAYENKIGIAFVTMESFQDANIIYKDYQMECFMPKHPLQSNLSKELNSSNWHITFAPHPNIIKWENLSSSLKRWYAKAILINLCVFTVLFVLTTPTYIINIMQVKIINFISKNNAFHRYIQSFFMWLVSVILPFLVYYSEILVGHWTVTSEHRNVFYKTYIFLITMILILPSLGIASLPAFVKWLLPNSNEWTNDTMTATVVDKLRSQNSYFHKILLQWLCIYAPGNCSFFVNYLITAAFLGTISELIRIPELVLYLYYQIVVKSSVEIWGIKKRVFLEYEFGLSYSWLLCVLAITVTYSLICPLVVPFGFIYILLRYTFDRYNIYHVYQRSYIDANMQRLILSFTVFAFLLLQINLLLYMKVRNTDSNHIYMFMFISFLLSVISFIILTINGWFTQYKTKITIQERKTKDPNAPAGIFMTPFLTPMMDSIP